MNLELFRLRVAKLWTSLTHPSCWSALIARVAPAVEHHSALRTLPVDGIIDVGANRGQFTLFCQLTHPGVPVLAFEPIPHEAETFRRVHGHRPHVHLLESALGETTGKATLHLSKSADSSSLLPIGKKQTELFQNTVEIGTITVPVQRLDDFGAYWAGHTRQLLKLDVQGFELQVLRGAVETLKFCAYVYVECSEVPLYVGQALRTDVETFLKNQGFAASSRHNEQWAERELVQADYLYVRQE